VKVGEEIKCHLVFSLERLVNFDYIKQLHCLADMNQLAIVDAQDLKIPHFRNEEFKKLSGQERNAMQLKVLEEISKVVDSKTCSHI
jgi:UDP-galactopyranose mutase